MKLSDNMKKLILFLFAMLAFTACDMSHEQFVVHETTPLYAEPDETSQVVGEQKYSDKEPVVAKRVNSAGTFALVKRVKQDEVEVEYWLPLTDINAVAPAGTTDKDEKSDLFAVVPAKLTFYARPAVDKKKAIFRLSKGDTIRAVGRHEGWLHAEVVQYTHTKKKGKDVDERIAVYGWVEETPANLEALGQITRKDYDRRALAKVNPKKAAHLTRMEDISSGKALLEHKRMSKLWPAFRITIGVSALLALIWTIIVLGKFTERAQCDRSFLPICLIVLVASLFVKYPHWYMSFVIPFMCLMLLYPLLLTKAARAFRMTYYIVCAGCTLVYLLVDMSANNYSGLTWLWHAFCFFMLGCFVLGLFGAFAERCDGFVCPHCTFYGLHYFEGSDEERSKPYLQDNGYTDEYSHSEYHGNTKVNYYTRKHNYSWKQTIITHEHFTCSKCGRGFTTHSSRTETL